MTFVAASDHRPTRSRVFGIVRCLSLALYIVVADPARGAVAYFTDDGPTIYQVSSNGTVSPGTWNGDASRIATAAARRWRLRLDGTTGFGDDQIVLSAFGDTVRLARWSIPKPEASTPALAAYWRGRDFSLEISL